MLQKTAKELAENIQGFLTDNEGEILYNLAKKCQGKGSIVEIGSWKGKSTVYLAKGSQDGNLLPIYAIDPHLGFTKDSEKNNTANIPTLQIFKENISKAGLADLIKPIVKTSEQAAKEFNKPIELIFIDGLHEYDNVKRDFDLWFPKVINGGIMAFHDTIGHQGPRKFARNFIFKSKNFRKAAFIDSIAYAEKVERNSLADRIRNRFFLLLHYFFDFGIKLKLPKPIRTFGKKILNKLSYKNI